MAKIFGEHKCSRCERLFTWDYHIPNRISDGKFDVEPIIQENVHARRINSLNADEWEMRVVCKYCNHIDIFLYNKK